ncbi:MAG TPA: formylglycine-generating enzyme family protein, partial [Nostocaceae cyanobacterium]|nr:formylglycine-generating enzyme family protein [Nostocaceae cyanobacterium]
YTYGSGTKGKYRQETTPVGSFPPNKFGLYDLHGNVWEWCGDDWHSNYERAPIEGIIWLTSNGSTTRLLRGGSWRSVPWFCRSAYRGRDAASYSLNAISFRVTCAAV